MPTLIPIESIEVLSSDRLHYAVEYSLARHEYNGKAQMVMNFVKYTSPEMAEEQEYVFALIMKYVTSRPKADKENDHGASHLALGTLLEKVNDLNLSDAQVVEFMTLVVGLGDFYVSLSAIGEEAWNMSSSVQDWEPFVAPEGMDYNSHASVIKYRNLRDEAHDLRPIVLFRILADKVQDKETKDKAVALAQGYFHTVDSRNAWACLKMREILYYAAAENGMNDDGVWRMKELLDHYEEAVRKMAIAKKIMEETATRLVNS